MLALIGQHCQAAKAAILVLKGAHRQPRRLDPAPIAFQHKVLRGIAKQRVYSRMYVASLEKLKGLRGVSRLNTLAVLSVTPEQGTYLVLVWFALRYILKQRLVPSELHPQQHTRSVNI